ncbi:hypothetical protein [Acidocella facilis]|uniref:hypothetical protein n=1 Tax=Acidocella facilis TaxID=525 RepID=UPI001F420069|nr:hypothetical protein [Acidocella facilis]
MALVLAWRCPSRLLYPGLWAEDGKLWLAGAYGQGVSMVLVPVVGYLQTISRLAALLAVHIGLVDVPLVFAIVAFAVQLLPAILLIGPRAAAWMPSRLARLLLIAFYLAEPNTNEVYVNLTNAMWHLALAAFLLVLLPKPRAALCRAFDLVVLVLSGLSGPLVLFIAPVAWWEAWRVRQRMAVVYAVVLSACALLQFALIMTSHAGRHGTLGATAGRLFHIIANQILLGGVIGASWVNQLLQHPAWHSWMGPGLVCLLGALAVGLAAWRGPASYHQLLFISLLSLAAALVSPMVSFIDAQWSLMQYPGVGSRYYFLPILAWFATLLVLAAGSGWVRWPARLVILACVIGCVSDFYVPALPDSSYRQDVWAFSRAAPGTPMTFHEAPEGWTFILTKQ